MKRLHGDGVRSWEPDPRAASGICAGISSETERLSNRRHGRALCEVVAVMDGARCAEIVDDVRDFKRLAVAFAGVGHGGGIDEEVVVVLKNEVRRSVEE